MKTMLLSCAFLLALLPAWAAANPKKTAPPYTSFQTPTQYREDNDIRTDAVIVYSNLKDRIQSWKQKGYVVQTMYGFRTGEDYISNHKDEGQTLADGNILTCGPGSYYMVPTPSRIKAAVDYFTSAIANGTSAVIPEEPEFFAITGYSDSFKKAWQERYGEPWRDQTSSIEARYMSERLKAEMEYDMVKAILDSAQKQDSGVARMVACHSPVSYYAWGIIYPHYQCLTIPSLQEIIGQVWTGTARTPCRYAGETAERTFENAFLEYSSLYNLARGTGKRMWFLMDPLEDNPDRSMEDYHANYEKTLVASLMFPEVDAFEVMPWPTRIYGRVPGEFATEISTIINALQDMHNQDKAHFDTGARGIATLIADSMGWQRGAPYGSDYDCFYALTLPLVYRGIPIQVAQLERAPEPDYLKAYKVLFVSYDILKPMKPEYNQALADWVKKGGVLVFFGGADAYNDLPEWWRDDGFASPQADLYSRLGISEGLRSLSNADDGFQELARANQRLRNLENRNVYTFQLEQFAAGGSPIYVRLRDAFPDDGWGPAVWHVKLTSGDQALADFSAGTPSEKRHMFEDSGSILRGDFRFADGDAYWTYRFDIPKGASPVLEIEMGNQFAVEVTDQPPAASWRVMRSARLPLTEGCAMFDVPSRYPLTLCKVMQGQIYHVQNKLGSAVFQRGVGKGTLIHVGISPAYFASSAQAAGLLRDITAYACEKAGVQYKEQHRMGIRRGKYVAMRTFDGQKELKGSYVDLLDPKLGVLTDPVIGPQRCALYCDVTSMLRGEGAGVPAVLYSSARVEGKIEAAAATALKLSGPKGTRGAVRMFRAGKEIESILPDAVKREDSGETVLLTFDNDPDSINIMINWR